MLDITLMENEMMTYILYNQKREVIDTVSSSDVDSVIESVKKDPIVYEVVNDKGVILWRKDFEEE